jgi:hypothetical protein
MTSLDIASLAELCRDALAEARAAHRDLADIQRLAVRTGDVLSRMEQRDETRFAALDERFAAIDHRFALIDTRFAAIDSRFAAVDGRLRGIDLRIGDLRGDLELMIRSELMATLASFEVRMMALIEQRLAARQ